MILFVDASGWPLAVRRDSPVEGTAVRRLREVLTGGMVYGTDLLLRGSLQGFRGRRGRARGIGVGEVGMFGGGDGAPHGAVGKPPLQSGGGAAAVAD